MTLEWGDGEYLFALKGKQIEALEAECMNATTGRPGVGLGAIWQRVTGGTWYYSDLRNVIRLGLMGGGLGAVDANRMCASYVDGVPISTINPRASLHDCPLLVAQAILAAAVLGIEKDDDPPGEVMTPKK